MFLYPFKVHLMMSVRMENVLVHQLTVMMTIRAQMTPAIEILGAFISLMWMYARRMEIFGTFANVIVSI